MKKTLRYLMIFLLPLNIILLNGCHTKDENSGQDLAAQEGVESAQLIFSKEQFAASGMKLGSPQLMQFQQSISANGFIEASAQGKAMVSTYIHGKVSAINVAPGQLVQKGMKLFSIESNEVIQLQEEYAETKGMMLLAKSNFERQKVLSEENIAAKKEFIRAESEYKVLLAKTEGLKARLKLINLNPEKIDQGIIVSGTSFFSPMKGYITSFSLTLGQDLQPNESVLEIIDTDQMQLVISIFRKDLEQLFPGQLVRYYDPDKAEQVYQAELIQIGKSIDNNTKTVHCLAKINKSENGKFVDRTFVKAEIITSERKTLALPAEALITEDARNFVLLKVGEEQNNILFKKTPVQIGIIQNSQVEVLEEGLENVLIEGLYNLSNN